jgi:hypothetical protein
MTREEQMRAWWEKLHLLYKLDVNKYFYERSFGVFCYEYMHPGLSPLTVHNQMFTIAVEKLASEEQNQKWQPLIRKMKMIGSYV